MTNSLLRLSDIRWIRKIIRNIDYMCHSNIERHYFVGSVEISERLMALEELFSPLKEESIRRHSVFEVPFSDEHWRAIKREAYEFKWHSIPGVKRAVKTVRHTLKIQHFRNSHVIKTMLKELKAYFLSIHRNNDFRKLRKIDRENIRDVSISYVKRREALIEELYREYKMVIKKQNRSQIVNDIEYYQTLFVNFFENEKDYLREYVSHIEDTINDRELCIINHHILDESKSYETSGDASIFLDLD